MCWIDKESTRQILRIRDKYNSSTFIETGTFVGINVRLYSFYWDEVLSCDICDEYLEIARKYNSDRSNVFIKKQSSYNFLKNFVKEYKKQKREDVVFIFLDAHFYDPDLSPEEKWVVVNELKALKGFKNCVICIHDFDCSGLGHCCYDGQPLGFPLVLEGIRKINPNFYLYVNTKEYCDIYNEKTIKNAKEFIINDVILDSVKHTNSCDRLTYRGFLYCTPTELNLDNFKLRRA